MDSGKQELVSPGAFGAVLSRAGIGKTAFVVQLALGRLLEGKNVLHISLNDPVNKVSLWYQELFNHLASPYDPAAAQRVWESLLPHRFIMTFKIAGFDAAKLRERMTDLIAQKIFIPEILIIDGLAFDHGCQAALLELKALAAEHGLPVWFTVRTHRHEQPDEDGLPVQIADLAELFDCIIRLQPEGKQIRLQVLKGSTAQMPHMQLSLDPTSMLVQNGTQG